MSQEFKQDWRQDKPALHMLYVKWAVKHLREIDRSIKRFCAFSNNNMFAFAEVLQNERDKIVAENAAYHDANIILQLAHGKKVSVE